MAAGNGVRAFGVLAALVVSGSVVHGEGSEIADGSVVIAALPFFDTGDVTDNADDVDFDCPFPGSNSPDVFYAFAPAEDVRISVILCESAFDTKTYILDHTFALVACNDDACEDASGHPFRSRIECVQLQGGEVYQIVVDGSFGDSGVYALEVQACEPCGLTCPPGALDEGEACGDDVNGGCVADPAAPAFTDLECGDVVCGTAWFDGVTRDTDWYRIVNPSYEEITWQVTAGHSVVVGLVETVPPGSSDCADRTGFIDPSTEMLACEEGAVTTGCVPPGEYWLFVAPSFSDVVACDDPESSYVAEVSCATPPGCAPPTCDGDLDDDGEVGFSDLLRLLERWGKCR